MDTSGLHQAHDSRPDLLTCLSRYSRSFRLKDGSQAEIRPIRPEDEALMVDFHQGLSETSVYYRYFGMLKLEQRISHARLARVCLNDFDSETALVVDRQIPKSPKHEILGVVRLSKIIGKSEAEFAIIVTDRWQHQGLGPALTASAIEIARAEGLTLLRAVILPENREMLHLACKHGFHITRSAAGEVIAELPLT